MSRNLPINLGLTGQGEIARGRFGNAEQYAAWGLGATPGRLKWAGEDGVSRIVKDNALHIAVVTLGRVGRRSVRGGSAPSTKPGSGRVGCRQHAAGNRMRLLAPNGFARGHASHAVGAASYAPWTRHREEEHCWQGPTMGKVDGMRPSPASHCNHSHGIGVIRRGAGGTTAHNRGKVVAIAHATCMGGPHASTSAPENPVAPRRHRKTR